MSRTESPTALHPPSTVLCILQASLLCQRPGYRQRFCTRQENNCPSTGYWPPEPGETEGATPSRSLLPCSSLRALGRPGRPACVSSLSISSLAGPPVRTPVTGSKPILVQHDLIFQLRTSPRSCGQTEVTFRGSVDVNGGWSAVQHS